MPTYTAIVLSGKMSKTIAGHMAKILHIVLQSSFPHSRLTKGIKVSHSENLDKNHISISYPEDADQISQSLRHVAENSICELYLACRDLGVPTRIIGNPSYVFLTRKGHCGQLIRRQLYRLHTTIQEPAWIEMKANTNCAVRMQLGVYPGWRGSMQGYACLWIYKKYEARAGTTFRIATTTGEHTVLMPRNYSGLRIEPGMWIQATRVIGRVSCTIIGIEKCQAPLFNEPYNT